MLRLFLTCTQRPRIGWLVVAAWVATGFLLSSLSGEQTPKTDFEIPHLDKIVHFLFYSGGGVALSRALDVTFGGRHFAIFIISTGLLAVYGWSDEYHQTFVPGRSGADVGDWLADVGGAVTGAILYLNIIKHVTTKRS